MAGREAWILIGINKAPKMNFDVYYIKPTGILQVMAFPAEMQNLFLFLPPLPAKEGTKNRLCGISGIRCRGQESKL
jgi:hypothetical protein